MAADNLYCVKHAEQEQLVSATCVEAGRSTCPAHGGAATSSTESFLGRPCVYCRATQRRAFFIVDQEPLCVRHAADAVFPDDDMGAHDMAHAAYIHLRAMGVENAY